ncbi:hypothetical protein IFR05_008707 [Cadophora sp. M221]|nr:hypothetical protein IFR05_008707 [Cadophora sp. M221]
MATLDVRWRGGDTETLTLLGKDKERIEQQYPHNIDAQNTQLFRQYMVDILFRAIGRLEGLRTEITFKEMLMAHITPDISDPMNTRWFGGLRAELDLNLTRVWAIYGEITLLTLIDPANYPAPSETLKNWRPILWNIEVQRSGLIGLSPAGVDYYLLWGFFQRGCSELKDGASCHSESCGSRTSRRLLTLLDA